jgi:hypothetical protein
LYNRIESEQQGCVQEAIRSLNELHLQIESDLAHLKKKVFSYKKCEFVENQEQLEGTDLIGKIVLSHSSKLQFAYRFLNEKMLLLPIIFLVYFYVINSLFEICLGFV